MYCTHADILELVPERTLVQLSNDDPKATDVDWGNVDASIRFASNTVDGYLRGRYSLPLVGVDELVKEWSAFIARWRLYQRRPDGKDLPLAVKLSYDDAVTSLKQVQAGKLHLGIGDTANGGNGVTDGGGSLQPEAGQLRIRSGVRQFPAERLNQF